MYLGRDFGVLQHFYKRRKPEYPKKTTDLPQVINKLYHIMLHRVHLSWAGFKLTTLLVIGTDCMGSYKSNYHTITTVPYIYLRNKINKTSPTITWFILYPFCIYLLLWICFVRMDFSEQYHIKGKAWEANGDEKSLSSKTYQR
jgi:hypothetical protein